jgi:Cd2+/Zn2+-exporting ATPase/Cu+-exporting ATPase
VLASIGAGAKKGLLIKGGKYLEALDKADIMLVDKTGTLTLGRPHITDVISLSGLDEEELLTLTASAERYSEHPIAESLRVAARERGYILETPSHFESVPGLGIRATVGQYELSVGSRRLSQIETPAAVNELEEKGKTVLYITDGSNILGLIALSDTLRSDVKEALSNVSQYGIEKIELLTGDNAKSAAELADQLNIPYRANLMPEDKIEVVKQYQKDGHVVIMIGDGVNDAPALAQANIGIVMAPVGSDVAIEASHISLLREDWNLVPQLLQISHRTMRVVRTNLGFTGVYNLIGLTLAAMGLLPPVFAAAAQSIPDLVIMANSSRLLRQ